MLSEQGRFGETKKYLEMVCDKSNSKDSYQIERIDGSLGPKMPIIIEMQIACSAVANLYYEGLGVRQDYSKALQYRKKACGLGSAGACSGAGFLYYVGEGTKKDYKLAKKYFEKACKMQYGGGCNLLAAMYMSGEGVPANFSKAKELFGKACDFGEQAGCDAYKNLNKLGVK
ncbi:tetratricopeptide repeat protein [Helicobacter sp. 23-1045]